MIKVEKVSSDAYLFYINGKKIVPTHALVKDGTLIVELS